MDHGTQKQRRRFSLTAWGLIVLAIVVLVCLWFVIRRGSVERRLEALRAAGYPTSFSEWAECHRLPPGVENAATLYEEAFDLIRRPDDDANVPLLGWDPLPDRGAAWAEPMLTDVAECLADNQPCLALLHKAASIEHAWYNWHYASVLPGYGGVRRCIWLLKLEMLFRIQQGDVGGVVPGIRSMLCLSNSLRQEAALIPYLTRMAGLSFSLRGMEWTLDAISLTDEQLWELDDMLVQTAATLDLAEVMVGERCWMIEMFQDPSLRAKNVVGGAALKLPGVMNTGFMDMLDYMDDVIEASGLPPVQRLPRLRAIDAAQQELPFWHFVTRRNQPALSRVAVLDARLRAHLDLTRAALAIERHRLATGEVPAELATLVPQYLEAVPIDPFDGQAIRYRRTEPGYLLYSIMEDGQDNGGRTPDEVKEGEPCDWCFIVTR